ncbi:Hypothetical protein GLP15_4900 [Giardia lamblia P15]|uniref:Uncharacterized protein n=1 Tax=Giardia intestinalis (strain P15) TaxID=658858 RepID=E1F9S3_GIAIA|nr:Hypothetical protein GLP15_4900 [Giardia lamblia P15]
METGELHTTPLQGNDTSPALLHSAACYKARDNNGESCTCEDTHKSIATDASEWTVPGQQGSHPRNKDNNPIAPRLMAPSVPAEAPIHLTTSKPRLNKLSQCCQSTRKDGEDSVISSHSLSRSVAYISSSTTTQRKGEPLSRSTGCTMSYCEHLRERLKQNRRPRNPHLLEGEGIHDRIDAVLNPDWHMKTKRCATQQGRLQYDYDHLRIISGLDLISAEHCYLMNEGVALADIQSIARRMEYGSIDPVSCITGLSFSPGLSAYKTFQQLTTPQTQKERSSSRTWK